MIFVFTFLIILIVALIVSFIIHLICQYNKRTRDDLQDLQFPLFPSNEISQTNVKFLSSSSMIHSSIHELISKAKLNVCICTFRWRVEWDEWQQVNGQIMAIGSALKKLASQSTNKITVSILMNQMQSLESNSFIENQVKHTWFIWHQLGFRNGDGNVWVEFRKWSHITLANIHSKFTIVDNQHFAMYSMNIEGFSHGREGSWIECGVECNNFEPYQLTSLMDYFQMLYTQSNMIKVNIDDPSLLLPSHTLAPPPISTSVPLFEHVPLRIVHRAPSAFSLSRKSELTMTLVSMLQGAKKSIQILTPNMNDISIINAIAHVPSRVVLSSGFNVDVPWIQEITLGWSTNERMKRQFSKHPNLSVRWNTHNGEVVQGKSKYALHAKLFLVDDQFLFCGSVNADVYATITSGECGCLFDSTELTTYVRESFFEHLWNQAVPV